MSYKFGSHDILIDFDYHITTCEYVSKTSTKVSGLKDHNRFGKIKDKQELVNLVNSITNDNSLDWNFEYFHSGEPVGLHTDYTTIPWDDEVECQVVCGIIIPLEWNCKQPYTINYNRTQDIPRKLMYRAGEMRYLDNNEIIHYRDKGIHDEESIKYNPKHTFYAGQFKDLLIHSVYQWKVGTCMLFDTKRWHSSSWFLSSDIIPDVSTEYKRSIVGFGSIDVPTGTLDELLSS